MVGSRYETRWAWIAYSVLILGGLFSIWGLLNVETDNEDVLRWLPDDTPARVEFEFFRNSFANDDYLVVSWPGCLLDDPRVDAFCQQLQAINRDDLIHSVTSGKDVLSGLADQAGLSRQETQRRLRGVFFGFDDPEQTCIVIVLGARGRTDRAAAVAALLAAAEQTDQLDAEELLIAGYPWMAVSMSQMIDQTFARLLPLSAILATLVALCCVRNLQLAILGLLASGLATGMSIAAAPALGYKIGGLTMMIPTLAFVLTKSGAFHITHYALDQIGDLRYLLRVSWKPCVLSVVTTMTGVLTLLTSQFPAVREFAWLTMVALFCSLLVQIAVYPWLLCRFGVSGLHRIALAKRLRSVWGRHARAVVRWRWLIVTSTVAALCCGVWGMLKLHPNVEAQNLFRPNSRVLQSIRNLEQQIGPLDQIELLLIYDPVSEDNFGRRLEDVRRLATALRSVEGVVTTHSLPDYIPHMPQGNRFFERIRQHGFRQRMVEQRDSLVASELLSLPGDAEIWRVSLRFYFLDREGTESIQFKANQIVDQFLEFAQNVSTGRDVPRVIFTGSTHLLNTSQNSLLLSVGSNFALAFAVITPILMIALRSFVLGVIGMVANVVPVIIVFGAIGWIGVPIDIALGMSATIALGIAVDDTTHFMVRFCDLRGSSGLIREPIQRAMNACGPAMLFTTVIACTGIFTFWFSELMVISRFAAAVSAMLVVAVVADLWFLPSMLAFAGRWGSRHSNPSDGHLSQEKG